MENQEETMGIESLKVDKGDGKRGTILEMMFLFARTKPSDDAFVFLATDKPREVVSWSELKSRSVKVAQALLDIGVTRGEIVAVAIRTCPEWLYMTLGAMLMGALPVNLVFTYKDGHDVVSLMEKFEKCSFLALDPGQDNENWNIFKTLVDDTAHDGTVRSTKMPYLRYLICHDPSKTVPGVKEMSDWMSEPHSEHDLPTILLSDPAFLFQTSGSTGIPKVVVLTHESFLSVKTYDDNGLDATETLYNDRPFGWLGGFPFAIMHGHKRVTVSGFSPPPQDKLAFIMEAVKNEECKQVLLLPPMIVEILSRKERQLGSDWFCEKIVTGGMPLTSTVLRAVGVICNEIVVLYAGTEFTFGSVLRVHDPEKYEDMCCGRPTKDTEVSVVDKEGNSVPVNTTGQIYIRSEWLFKCYLNDPDRSKNAKTDDGWYKTGDVGRINEASELFVIGRMSNEIIRGGMTISPEILEFVLKKCPLIAHALIVPIPDDVLYQELCACVIFKPGVKASVDDVRKYCEEIHADSNREFSYLPAYYLTFDKFPMTGPGKFSRLTVADEALDRIRSGRSDKSC